MEWNDEEYLDRKNFWDDVFDMLGPRDNSQEEYDAFINALEDKLDKCE